MSLKLGDTDIAGTQVLYSNTGSNTDGAMTQAATTTALSNKADNSAVASAIAGRADTTLSNISNTSTTSIDGQWVNRYLLLANEVSRNSSSGNTSYSLSNYLPNDGYKYEVIVGGLVYTDATSGKFMSIVVKSDLTSNVDICSCRTRTSSQMDTRGTTIIPVGTGRYVQLIASSNSNYSGKVSLAVYGYRRIGTNT